MPKAKTLAWSSLFKPSNWPTMRDLILSKSFQRPIPQSAKSSITANSASWSRKNLRKPRKKQKIVEIKEIKLRPGIDDHDYGVKMKAVRRFFREGDKVKVTLRFRGREMAHQELGFPPARTGEIRDRGHRQGRSRAVHGRPPDDHGSPPRQKIGIGASWPGLASWDGARSTVFLVKSGGPRQLFPGTASSNLSQWAPKPSPPGTICVIDRVILRRRGYRGHAGENLRPR